MIKLSETRRCTHGTDKGGVYGDGDPYETLRKLGIKYEWPWSSMCWSCYDEWGRDVWNSISEQTTASVREKGLCGFLEAWIGHCLNDKPCAKHDSQKCFACKRPATRNCSEAGSLVCGAPECDEHNHH